MFDTGTPEGQAALMREAVAAINGNMQLRKDLAAAGDAPGGAEARHAAVQRLLDASLAEAAQHDEDILATVQGGEEGQESLDIAVTAANDMAVRLRTFSSRASELRGLVEGLRRETRPLEHAQAHINVSIAAVKDLSLMVAALRELAALSIHSAGSRTAYFERAAAALRSADAAQRRLEGDGVGAKLAASARLAPVVEALGEARATAGINCRTAFKQAQQRRAGAGAAPPPDDEPAALQAAAGAAEAVGPELVREVRRAPGAAAVPPHGARVARVRAERRAARADRGGVLFRGGVRVLRALGAQRRGAGGYVDVRPGAAPRRARLPAPSSPAVPCAPRAAPRRAGGDAVRAAWVSNSSRREWWSWCSLCSAAQRKSARSSRGRGAPPARSRCGSSQRRARAWRPRSPSSRCERAPGVAGGGQGPSPRGRPRGRPAADGNQLRALCAAFPSPQPRLRV
jgi:hypothetical protein